MPAPGPSSPPPPPNAAMVYRPTSPDHESRRLMADSGRYDDDYDGSSSRRRPGSLRLRLHLVNCLRALVALLGLAAICITGSGDTVIPAAVPVFVFGALAVVWNGAVLFERAFGCFGRGRPRCLCFRLPVCLCRLGACRLGCGDDDEEEEGDPAVLEKGRRPSRLWANAIWVVDLLFAAPFMITPSVYSAQAELYWWARYNRGKLTALNAVIWSIFVLFILIAAFQHIRLGRGVTITITPDEKSHNFSRSRGRSPRRSPP